MIARPPICPLFRLIPFGLPASCARSNRPPTTKARWAIFLPDFLADRGWECGEDARRTAEGESRRRPALECLCWQGRRNARSGFFHAHGHRAALHPVQRGCGFSLWPRSLRRQGNPGGPGRRRRGASRAGLQDWPAVCQRRRARLGRRHGGQPCAQGQPLPHQRRTDG